MEEKCVDPEVQLDVDEMILDYLIFTATATTLNDYEDCGNVDEHFNSSERTNVHLQLVDC